MIEKARNYATKYHLGQFRKKCNLPYIVHPMHVVRLLKKYGIDDEEVLSMGYLHDTMEDTDLTYDKIELVFGKRVADGVYLLTRNVGREEYKKRLLGAPLDVFCVKLCDTLDNLVTVDQLNENGIERKLNDSLDFYIPLAEKMFPDIARKMMYYIGKYLKKNNFSYS